MCVQYSQICSFTKKGGSAESKKQKAKNRGQRTEGKEQNAFQTNKEKDMFQKKMLVSLVLVFFCITSVHAYNTHGVYWPVSSVSYDAHTMSSSWKSAVAYGSGKWEYPADFDWRSNDGSVNDVYLYDIDGRGGVYAYVSHWTLNSWITKIRIRFDVGESWYTGSSTPSSTRLDARSIATHEFGHGMGVAHTQSYRCGSSVSEFSRPTMCATYAYGKTYFRTLENDDENAVEHLYDTLSFIPALEGASQTEAGEEIRFDFVYETLTKEERAKRALAVLHGYVVGISETRFNQDSGEYWEDVSEDGETMYTAIPYYEVDVELVDILSGDTSRFRKTVTLTVIGEQEETSLSLGDELVAYVRDAPFVWRGDTSHSVIMPMSDPLFSLLSRRDDGLYRELDLKDAEIGFSLQSLTQEAMRPQAGVDE
ncbi:MAG: matrixin family metalloprotease [Patescibacteria group bacterium]